MHRVTFHTLGCKLNQCETAQMEEALSGRGFDIVPWDRPATVRVLNTCTVTSKTDRECRRLIRRAKREDPGARVVVTGCYAQIAPDKVAAIQGVDLVLGNLDKLSLADHLERLVAEQGGPAREPRVRTAVTAYGDAACADLAELDVPGGSDEAPLPTSHPEFITHFSGYTRAFLKVQNGCDSRCAYCIIPEARGPSRSMPLGDVVEQVRILDEKGFREVVLTGIHIGAWGRNTGEGDLADLLEALLGESEIGRLRLSSTEPMELTDRVLDAARSGGPRFAEHFHVPLQSGSNAVLRRMNRPYDAPAYAERVTAIRDAFPDAAIGADVIVGFPGETEAEFEETAALIEGLPLTYLHVFAYSDRPGTRASAMADKVPPETISARSQTLRRLSAAKLEGFQTRFRGRDLEALVLAQTTPDGRRVGLTGNYLEVALERADELENRFALVRPETRRQDGRWDGMLVEELDR